MAASRAPKQNPREQILEATRSCLNRVGFENVTTRRIAEEAGVNIATLHYYFGTKEALLTEAVRYALGRTEALLRSAVDGSPDAAAALEAVLNRILEMVRERAGVLRYDLVVRGFRDADAHREVTAVYAAFRRLLEEILERHIAAGGVLPPRMTVAELANYIVSIVDGVVLQHTITADHVAAEKGLTLIMAHALALLGAGNEEKADEPTRL